MLGSVTCRKSHIGAKFHCLLVVKPANVFSNHVMMHDSFSIVVAFIAYLLPTFVSKSILIQSHRWLYRVDYFLAITYFLWEF